MADPLRIVRAERDARIFLNRIPSLGPMRFHRLLEKFGSASAALEWIAGDVSGIGISEATALEWQRATRDERYWAQTDRELERSAAGDFQILTEIDEGYPELLRPLVDRPPVLYVKGGWPIPGHFPIGIVGTRRPTSYGLQMARSLARDLCRSGAAVISGLAIGIDGAAHSAALHARGYTVAALGHGLGHRYPRQNAELYEAIPESGCLVTEFPVDCPPDPGHFPRRNRIISGLSQGVLVIEAGIKSGALITARYAAEQGRDVFAVPGPVTSPMSQGCNYLIKEGAQLVEGIEDILEAPVKNASKIQIEPDLHGLEAEVYRTLQGNPAAVDELAVKLTRPVDQLARALLSLELRGLIRPETGQRYGIQIENCKIR